MKNILTPTNTCRNISPLRYPGGKTRAVSILKEYIPSGTKEICSPFFGGGSFELTCALDGYKIYGYDIFEPLVDFWDSLLNNKEALVGEVKKYFPLEKSAFYNLQKEQMNLKDKIQRGAAFFVLNRSSFSGATLSGGMSPGHPRFTESAIERLANFNISNFTVERKSFHDSIKQHKNCTLYLDPPYLIKNTLYGHKGDTHRDFDHLGLLSLLKKRNNWILSYNNSEEIRELYADYVIEYPTWKYGMSNDKDSKEVLILSHDIADQLKKRSA